MGGPTTEKHPGVETLHAFAAGEVPPGSVSSAIAAHVARCEVCAAELRKVNAVRDLFSSMAPEPLDDLRWARLARRVQAELRAAPRATPRDWMRWWAPAAVVGATVAAGLMVVSVWPRAPGPVELSAAGPADARADLSAGAEAEDAAGPATLRVANEPIDVTLENGLRLRLGPAAEIRLLESGLERVELELERGELAVWSDRDGAEIALRAPDLVATARGPASFTVARLTDAPTAFRVERGEVKVARPGEPLHAESASPVASPTKLLPRSRGARTAPPLAPIAPGAPVALAASPSAEASAVAAPAAPLDRWEAALRAYESRRLEEAVDAAEDVLASRPDPERTRLARELVCDAELALDRPARAAEACEALLPLLGAAEARALHFRVATLYRARLHDCAKARAHYDRMVVVGARTLMDQDALLGRAECALDSGDLDAAARDLGFLSGQKLGRPTAYEALATRLAAAKRGRSESDR